MTKNFKKINTIVITLLLALICGLFYCLTIYIKSTNTYNPDILRTIEVNQMQVNYQSVLEGFDDVKLETVGNITTFEGTKTLDWSDFEAFDNVSESDLKSQIGCAVKYNVEYDAESNVVILSAVMENAEELAIENIYGSAFIDENGRLDAVMDLDGEYILLSEMQNLGMIENCGWFSNIFKKIVKVAVAAVAVAACVATAGMAVGAVIAVGAAVCAAESVATQLLETGTICMAALAVDTLIGAIPGGRGAKALAKMSVSNSAQRIVQGAGKQITSKTTSNMVKISNNVTFEKLRTHIFSAKHKNGGIMKLGSSEKDIFEKLLNKSKENFSKFKEGSNEIRTRINNQEVTKRVEINNGEMINMNGFIGYSDRAIGNLISN